MIYNNILIFRKSFHHKIIFNYISIDYLNIKFWEEYGYTKLNWLSAQKILNSY